MEKIKEVSNLAELKSRFKQRLIELGAIEYGEFTLKSGAKSDMYFDMRIVLGDPEALTLITDILRETIPKGINFIVLSGLAGQVFQGILPQITKIPFIFVSKSEIDRIPLEIGGVLVPKLFLHCQFNQFGYSSDYTNKIPTAKSIILFIDDVMTAGSARREVNEILGHHFDGAEISGALVLIDRNELDKSVQGVFKGSDFNK